MTRTLSLALALALLAGAASAQTVPVSIPKEKQADHDALQDRVTTLLQANKCALAHEETVKAGDTLMTQQVEEFCVARGYRPVKGGPNAGKKSPRPGKG